MTTKLLLEFIANIGVFSRKAIYYWFSQAGITFWTELCSKKNFHPCAQARLGRQNHCHSWSNMTRYITDKKRGSRKILIVYTSIWSCLMFARTISWQKAGIYMCCLCLCLCGSENQLKMVKNMEIKNVYLSIPLDYILVSLTLPSIGICSPLTASAWTMT